MHVYLFSIGFILSKGEQVWNWTCKFHVRAANDKESYQRAWAAIKTTQKLYLKRGYDGVNTCNFLTISVDGREMGGY